ncbi:MAG: hypothetical protein KDD19_00620, partial [Phaeodactylibacter sp.]|nr:hypothetical protein [Phaeodactylibacter sp.]
CALLFSMPCGLSPVAHPGINTSPLSLSRPLDPHLDKYPQLRLKKSGIPATLFRNDCYICKKDSNTITL